MTTKAGHVKLFMKLDNIYQDVILDHHKNPRCHGCVSCPDAACALRNPMCGDHIDLTVRVDGEKVSDIKFSGHGCAISQASASMMSDLCQGKTLSQVGMLASYFRAMMRGEKAAEEVEELGDAVALEGVRNFSARVKCAMLAWEALEKCVGDLKTSKGSTSSAPLTN